MSGLGHSDDRRGTEEMVVPELFEKNHVVTSRLDEDVAEYEPELHTI